jgi:hypothetical protein
MLRSKFQNIIRQVYRPCEFQIHVGKMISACTVFKYETPLFITDITYNGTLYVRPNNLFLRKIPAHLLKNYFLKENDLFEILKPFNMNGDILSYRSTDGKINTELIRMMLDFSHIKQNPSSFKFLKHSRPFEWELEVENNISTVSTIELNKLYAIACENFNESNKISVVVDKEWYCGQRMEDCSPKTRQFIHWVNHNHNKSQQGAKISLLPNSSIDVSKLLNANHWTHLQPYQSTACNNLHFIRLKDATSIFSSSELVDLQTTVLMAEMMRKFGFSIHYL